MGVTRSVAALGGKREVLCGLLTEVIYCIQFYLISILAGSFFDNLVACGPGGDGVAALVVTQEFGRTQFGAGVPMPPHSTALLDDLPRGFLPQSRLLAPGGKKPAPF
jgi:hypothetical protein